MTFNVDQYLLKLGLSDKKVELSAEFLKQVHYQHIKVFPYNNMELHAASFKSALQRAAIDISADYVFDQFLLKDKGGFCYQTGELLFCALEKLRFTVERRLAWVLNNEPVDQVKQKYLRTHEILIVTLDGQRWLLDPGFAARTPRYPVLFEVSIDGTQIITQDNDQFRLNKLNDEFRLDMWVNDAWMTLYQFADTAVTAAENLSSANELLFCTKEIPIRDQFLLFGLVNDAGRFTLRMLAKEKTADLLVLRKDGIHKQKLTSWFEIKEAIGKYFGFKVLPELEEKYGSKPSIAWNMFDNAGTGSSVVSVIDHSQFEFH